MTARRVFREYELVDATLSRMLIRRRDRDHPRTVAFVDTEDEWRRFVAAIEAGADEVAAVRAIDEPRPADGLPRRADDVTGSGRGRA